MRMFSSVDAEDLLLDLHVHLTGLTTIQVYLGSGGSSFPFIIIQNYSKI